MLKIIVSTRLPALALTLSTLVLTACTPAPTLQQIRCQSNADCVAAFPQYPGGYCVDGYCFIADGPAIVEAGIADMLTPPADLAPAPRDLAPPPPDLYGVCSSDEKRCLDRCIPKAACCSNVDCLALGQTCQNDGSCQCPGGQSACMGVCQDNSKCCTGADCASKVCSRGICAIASCGDGVQNGSETDIDCGGGFCGPCIVLRGCGIASDCRANACISSKCAEVGFGAALSYGGGSGATYTATGDFNLDGKPDVAVASAAGNSVSIVQGRGDGTLMPLGSYAVGLSPATVQVADLNLDGRPDLVVPNQGSFDVSVLLGNGDGTFQPAQSYVTGGQPRSVAVGDMNGDRRPDLVVTNALSQTVTILAGRGDGTFTFMIDLPTGVSPIGAVVGDWNKDRAMDVAVLNNVDGNAGSITISLGKGGGAFDPPSLIALPIGASRQAISSGDYNGDGAPDLAVGSDINLGAVIAVLIGKGNGGFQVVGMTQAINLAPGYLDIVSTDVSGDGKLDLVTSIGVHLGNGNGSFAPLSPYPGNAGARNAAPADLDGDKLSDVAYPGANQSSTVNAIKGKGDGTFLPIGLDMQKRPQGSSTDITVMAPRAVAISDVNGDGRGDVIVTSANDNSVDIFIANANGTLELPSAYGAGAGPVGVASNDLNGDGKADIAVALSGEANVAVLLNSGNGRFMPASKIKCGAAFAYVQIADLNSDGKLDIVGLSTAGGVIVIPGKGDGGFGAPSAAYAAGPGARQVVVAEVTGDGNLDVIVANGGANTFAIFPGNGDLTLGKLILVAVAPNTVRVGGVAPADLNGDDITDFIVADAASQAFYVSLGLGMNKYAPAVAYNAGGPGGPHLGLVSGDFDKDGHPDFAACNVGDRSISVMLGKPDGTLKAAINHDVGVAPINLDIGDINGDKRLDLVIANQGSSTISVLLNVY